MRVDLYIPYFSSDPVEDFTCDRDMTVPQFFKEERDEHYAHTKEVEYMTHFIGENISNNPYKKKRVNVRQQRERHFICEANIMKQGNADITPLELDSLYRSGAGFPLYVYLNRENVSDDYDLGIEMNLWIRDSLKIWALDTLSPQEALKHLPKKDFQIIPKDVPNFMATLKDCRFAEAKGSSTAFAMLVSRVILKKQA